ncbi:hypothetical protein [Pedobacter foliorum]|uniref:hypothetical protein n=1 Tax=Pedobacter foliorum TaxID=2739058 RepID=UPI001566A36B|nr:hypothetical protein [Pedobacter foliorum]NRF41413.1 hypothetical protein [Pedobacter foliorum]
MKEYKKLTPPSKKRTIWTYINCIVIILCIYAGIFQQYHRVNLASAGMLLIISWHTLNALKRLWIDTSEMNWVKHLFPLVILITLGLSAVAIGKLEKVYLDHQLTNYGLTITGKVEIVNTREFPILYAYYSRYALVRYKLNNRYFMKEIDNKKQKLVQGDSIKLKVSTQHPEIVEAVY